ncbi:MAG: hypothetical protein Q9224_002870 [Gallowayella concinna]
MDPSRPVISQRCVSQIRKWHVRVRLDCDPYYEAEVVAQTFTNALELEIEVFRASWDLGSYDALEGFTKVRGVGRAFVHGSIRYTYAFWLQDVMKSNIGTQAKTSNPTLSSQDQPASLETSSID